MVECTLFDSRDCWKNADWMWENWEEVFDDEPKPEKKPEERLQQLSWDQLMDDHYNLAWELKHRDPGRLILAGTLGLWNCRPSAYKVVDPDNAIGYMKDDYELSISYEDGDICTYHYHHDGTNCVSLYELREFDSLNLTGLTPDDIQTLANLYTDINCKCYLNSDEWSWLYKVTKSTASFFKDYLSSDALEDLAKREAEYVDPFTPEPFEALVVDAPSDPDKVLTMREAGKELDHWYMRNQDGHVYCYVSVYIDGDGTYDFAYQMDKDHQWRCVGLWNEFEETHKDDEFTYYEEEK